MVFPHPLSPTTPRDFPFSILKPLKDVKTIAKARIIIVIVNLILAVPLILIFKLDGAIAFVPLSYLVNLLVNFIFAKNNYFNELNINIILI
jgi:O-antigen/teichoic acid export membrane protein